MSFLGKIVLASAVVAAAGASPAFAVTDTFAQFSQRNNVKIFQYRNITSGPNVASLNAVGNPSQLRVNFSPLDLPVGLDGSETYSIALNSFATTGPVLQGADIVQSFSGTLSFTLAAAKMGYNGLSTNALTVNFQNAVLRAGVGSAAPTVSITFAPDTTSFMSSGFFDFTSFPIDEENFSLSFSAASKLQGSGSPFVLSNGRISNFNANATGTFASSPPPIPSVPEPASWALMLVGFGAVGAGLRSRQRAFVAA